MELEELEKLEKLETNKERGCFHNESILFFLPMNSIEPQRQWKKRLSGANYWIFCQYTRLKKGPSLPFTVSTLGLSKYISTRYTLPLVGS